MTLITPVGGREFNWAPQKSGLTKQASTEAPSNLGKDALYEAAKKAVAQFEEDNKECDTPPCDDQPVVDAAPATDAVKAVSDLAEKAEKAEQVASAVQSAVEKVEEAVQGVKDAVGATDVAEVATEVKPDEVEIDAEVEVEDEPEMADEGEADEVEIEFEYDELPPGNLEGEGDEIVKEGDEEEAEEAEVEEDEFEKEASSNAKFVKVSEISPENKKKLYSYWHDVLGFPEDYCKLLVK